MIVSTPTHYKNTETGEQLLRTSSILGVYPWTPGEHVKAAGRIGNAMHDKAEICLLGMQAIQNGALPDVESVDVLWPQDLTKIQLAKAKLAFAGLGVFLADYPQMKILHVEVLFFSTALGFGGTCDLICEIDGKIIVIDWKTSSEINRMRYGLQVVAYAAAAAKHLGLQIEEAWVVRFNKGRYDKETKTVIGEPGYERFAIPRADFRGLWLVFKSLQEVAACKAKLNRRYLKP